MFRAILAFTAVGLAGCAQTTHDAVPSNLGRGTTLADLEARLAEPGPIRMEKVAAADWVIPLGGMLNLDHPRAEAAGLNDDPTPIQIYFYALRHPAHGTYMVDTGIARSIARQSEDMPISWLVQSAMDVDTLVVHVDTQTWLQQNDVELAGVLMTHLHLDHVLGLQDIPKQTPVYVGPGEADDSKFGYLFARSTTDANLEGFGPLREFSIEPTADSQLGVVDILGDGSLYGLHIPGHTAGNMAYLVRTTEGPALLTGDGCHTRWGWEHGVEPGTFNTDGEQSAESLRQLRALAERHPEITVHLGHQPTEAAHHEQARLSPRR